MMKPVPSAPQSDVSTSQITISGKAIVGVLMPQPQALTDALRREVNELDYSVVSFATLPKFLARFNDETPALIVLDLDLPHDEVHAVMECARDNWPFAEVLGVSAHPEEKAAEIAGIKSYGRIQVLGLSDPSEICRQVSEILNKHSYGLVRGITLPSLLQILEWEMRTLDLKVEQGVVNGRLHFIDGQLIDATVIGGPDPAPQAASRLLALDRPRIWLKRSYHDGQSKISVSLQSLLMDAMVLRDHDDAGDLLLSDPVAAESAATVAAPMPAQSFKAQPGRGIADVLEAALAIDGAMGSALVEYGSGMALGTAGYGLDLNVAAAGNTEVVRAKRRTMEALGISGSIEDILITLDDQYHIIYMLPNTTLFLYLVLRKDLANLALARFKLKALSQVLTF